MKRKLAETIAGHLGHPFGDLPKTNKERKINYAYDNSQEDLLDIAEAVLKAMMEPSEAMIEAGHEAYHPSPDYGLDDEDLGLAYKAMINAALEEE